MGCSLSAQKHTLIILNESGKMLVLKEENEVNLSNLITANNSLGNLFCNLKMNIFIKHNMFDPGLKQQQQQTEYGSFECRK